MSSDTPLPKSSLLAAGQAPSSHDHHAQPAPPYLRGSSIQNAHPHRNLTANPPTTTSPLLNLPSEIRLLIYSYLLPHAQDITFHPLTRKHPTTSAPTAAHAVHITPGAPAAIWPAFLRACRQLHAEGADALYAANRFHFALTSRERVWASAPGASPAELNNHAGATSPRRSMPRGLPVNTLRTSGLSSGGGALRRMRWVRVRIEEDLARPEAFRRVQGWLREMVEGFAGGGRGGGAALQELRVELVTGTFRYGGFPSFTQSVFWEFLPERNQAVGCQYQFVLEPLAGLRGVRCVEIRGHVADGFGKKLAERMMGEEGGEEGVGEEQDDDRMEAIEYGVQTVERKRKGRCGPDVVMRSLRKFYEPQLDWQLEGE